MTDQQNNPSKTKANVLVIGGGFGGLAVTKALRKAPVEISLVDRSNHHVFQPLLYQVATSILSSTDIATPLRQIFRHQKNVSVFLSEVTSIDLDARSFTVGGEEVPFCYDYLVVATGSQQSYFGHDEFAPYAPGLKSLSDAEYLRNKILTAFENAEKKITPSAYPELLTFVLVGGGPTGVEMAGAICEMARRTLLKEYSRFDPSMLRVILVQGGSRILPQFPEELSLKALERLQKLGVEVLLNAQVTGVDAEGVLIGEKRIASKNVIWTAGVAPHPLIKSLGLATDRSGRVVVQPDCSVEGHPEVFVIGDAASFATPEGRALPGVAQVALQQGAYVGKVIESKIEDKAPPPPFRYFDKGSLAIIGAFYAVMDSFGIRSAGSFAYLVWLIIHLQFLGSTLNQFRTGLQWLWMFSTSQLVGRLIIQPKGVASVPESIN